MEKVVNALVNLMVCPRKFGGDDCCEMCDFATSEGSCYGNLINDSMSTLRANFGKQTASKVFVMPNAPKEEVSEHRQHIVNMLREMGMPVAVLGYKYVRTAIELALTDEEYTHHITKMLYPGVAEAHNTIPTRVERAIRHAIERTWDTGDYDVLAYYFGSSTNNARGNPTNSEFIAVLVDHIKLGRPLYASK